MARSINFAIGLALACIATSIVTSMTAYAAELRQNSQNQSVTTFHQTTFSGIPIPGNAADAIAANFGSCNPNKEKDGLICVMTDSQIERTKIMGAPIKSAKLTLKSKSKDNDKIINIRSVPINQLVYNGIDFELASTIRCYDQSKRPSKIYKKLQQGEAPSCWSGQRDFDYVRSKLAAAGWVAGKTIYSSSTNEISIQNWDSKNNSLLLMMFSPSSIAVRALPD